MKCRACKWMYSNETMGRKKNANPAHGNIFDNPKLLENREAAE